MGGFLCFLFIMKEISIPPIQELRLGDFKQEAILARKVYDILRQSGKPNNYNEYMVKALTHHIASDTPIPIAGFWGVGERENLNEHDNRFLDSLSMLKKKISEVYSYGAEIKVILADLHGVFNGHIDRKAIQVFPQPDIPYLNRIQEELHKKDIKTIWLSELYKQCGMQLPDIHEPIDEDSEAYAILKDPQRQEGYLYSSRHSRRGVPAIQAAYHYIRERLAEKPMLEKVFKDSLFFVNGGRNLASRLMPEDSLPIHYLHEGPVWFMTGTERR